MQIPFAYCEQFEKKGEQKMDPILIYFLTEV